MKTNSIKILSFEEPSCLEIFSSSIRDVTRYLFEFSVVDSSLVYQPEEISETLRGKLVVGITRELNYNWRLNQKDLIKVLFEFGKRHIIQKIKDRTLAESEELLLTTSNSSDNCPFDPSRIPNPNGPRFKVEITNERIMDNPDFQQLAASIIDTRDNINAIFHQKHKEKLIDLVEERDLLQFFRDATSQEEFFFRLCVLKNAVTNLNIKMLQQLTRVNDFQIRSIGLLKIYLQQLGNFDSSIIETFMYINRLRQGYPIHGDRVEGVLDAHAYFNIEYPVKDFSNTWKTLFLHYLDALKKLFDIVR